MTIVTNTGPLVILAKIDQLGLLQQMFRSIAIPPAVHRELLAKSGPEVSRLDAALKQFIEIVGEPEFPPAVKIVIEHLDAGEQQAIALAYVRNTMLVIDERLGRQAARQLAGRRRPARQPAWFGGDGFNWGTDRSQETWLYPGSTAFIGSSPSARLLAV